MRKKIFWDVAALGWAVAATVVGVLGWATTATAADCGDGVKACQCGDTVVANTTLNSNIGGCRRTGLFVVGSSIVLNCGGHTLTGAATGNDDNDDIGIHLDPATGAEVNNCSVSGFRQGIRIGSGHNNRIINNVIFGNRKYGIEVAGASTGNLLQGNRVGKPGGSGVTKAEEGIHNGSGSHNTVIRENVVIDSKEENIYVLKSNNVQVILNISSETDSAAIFLKNSHGAFVGQNTVTNGSITVRGDSSGNTFVDNTISGGRGYLFEAHQDEAGDPSSGYWRFPRRNTVTGGSVKNPVVIPNTDPPIFPCLRFEGSYKNRVEQLQLDAKCTPPSQTPDGGQESVGNVINTMPLP